MRAAAKMRSTTVVGLWLLMALLTYGNDASAQPPAARREARLEQWLVAVYKHEPGMTADDSLRSFGAWTARQWQDLIIDSLVFARGIVNPDEYGWVPGERGQRIHIPARFYSGATRERISTLVCAFAIEVHPRCNGRPTLEGELAEFASQAAVGRMRGDPYAVLRKATLLHTDLLAWGGTRDTMSTIVSTTNTRLWLNNADGQAQDLEYGGAQWQIAYGLVDTIVAHNVAHGLPHDGWVRDWYVATAAWMQAESRYDQEHITHALTYYRNDPDLRFFSATLHEIDASAGLQLSLRAASLPAGATSQVDSLHNELRDAAADLRIVIAARPQWSEAHLRLGRVLIQLGDREAAIQHLNFALTSPGSDVVEYLAALFLGDAEFRRGQVEAARAMFRRAASMFPAAQSPYLALSQLERQQGHRDAAQAAIAQVFRLRSTDRDPWWEYLYFQAHEATPRLNALRRPVMDALQ